jgi:hypothetical protein
MRNEILSLVSDTFRVDREKGTSDCVYSEVRVETWWRVALKMALKNIGKRDSLGGMAFQTYQYIVRCYLHEFMRKKRGHCSELVASHCTRQPGR